MPVITLFRVMIKLFQIFWKKMMTLWRVVVSLKFVAIAYLFSLLMQAREAKDMVRKQTGIIYDRHMVEHKCIWDPNYPECPERFTRVLER